MTHATTPPVQPGCNAPPAADAAKVDWAVWNARQGFRVMPVKSGAKFPPTVRKALATATNDESEIRRLWSRPGHSNDNPALYLPDHVALDLDTVDREGNSTTCLQSVERLGLTSDDLKSALIVRTPKGRHAYWRRPDGIDVRSANAIEPFIDLRALGGLGYLIGAGAEVVAGEGKGGSRYEIVRLPVEVGELPSHLLDAILARQGTLRRRPEAGAVAKGAEPDSEAASSAGRVVASDWPPAVDGSGGHKVLLGLVMRLGDLGLQPDAAIEVLFAQNGWNNNCSPPWDLEELDYQVRTIYGSRSRHIGCDQPGAEFAGVSIVLPAGVGTGSVSSSLVTRSFADIELRAIEWLWPGLVPKGYLTIVAGESGAGKSTVLADIVARVSTGTPWPGEVEGPQRRPGRVLWLGAEDSAAEMTGPRLHACGADMGKVIEIVASRRGGGDTPFSMQDDIGEVEKLLVAQGTDEPFDMLVIDPITSYLPGLKLRKVDLNDAGQLRSILEPWLRLAEARGLAVICVTHFGKDTGRAMMHRVLGSSAFAQTCRSLLAVVQQPPALDCEADPFAKALLQVKTNLPEHPGGAWTFRTERVEVGTDRRTGKPILATRPIWVKLDARLTPESVASGSLGNTGAARKDAKFSAWLERFFSKLDPGAWADAGEVQSEAEGDGVASKRWWRDNSQLFLEKINDSGKWVCRPIQELGVAGAPPIVMPDPGAPS